MQFAGKLVLVSIRSTPSLWKSCCFASCCSWTVCLAKASLTPGLPRQLPADFWRHMPPVIMGEDQYIQCLHYQMNWLTSSHGCLELIGLRGQPQCLVQCDRKHRQRKFSLLFLWDLWHLWHNMIYKNLDLVLNQYLIYGEILAGRPGAWLVKKISFLCMQSQNFQTMFHFYDSFNGLWVKSLYWCLLWWHLPEKKRLQ